MVVWIIRFICIVHALSILLLIKPILKPILSFIGQLFAVLFPTLWLAHIVLRCYAIFYLLVCMKKLRKLSVLGILQLPMVLCFKIVCHLLILPNFCIMSKFVVRRRSH